MIITGTFVDLISGETFHAYDPGRDRRMPARCPALEHLIELQRVAIRHAERERERREILAAQKLPKEKHAQARLF